MARAPAHVPVRLIHSPWPQPGEPQLAPDASASPAQLVSAVDLPRRSILLDLSAPLRTLHYAPPPSTPTTPPTPPAPLTLHLASRSARTPVALQPFAAHAPAPSSPSSPALLDCAGHVYDLLWLPSSTDEWLLAACASTRSPRSTPGKPTPGTLLLWRVPPGGVPELALTMSHSAGAPLRLVYISSPASDGLALIAAVFSDGSVRLLHIPSPGPNPAVQLHDVLTLTIPSLSAASLAYADGLLACGTLTGDVVLWKLPDAIDGALPPAVAAPVHDSAVTALAWLPSGHLFSVGLDGSEYLLDPAAPFSAVRLAHAREPRYAAATAPWISGCILDLGDNHYGSTSLQHDVGQHHTIAFHHGRILSLAASPFHPYAASGSADGSVKIANVLTASKRKALDPRFRIMHKLFRLSAEADGTLAMLHDFLPEGTAPRASSKAAPPLFDHWDPAVGIHALAWSPNIGRGLLLASGSASGIVRLDWVEAAVH
ncbi:hypothetical protein MCUN1_001916 [Malassezia cuniculi]|uniref:Uncharacterized protein n=1 Tax=Malassezia cuniculi TaxID=948313 RepID=A0AAF0J622_9BASI|nr:hypothetical protein MCUN1_001916 [Malassezia cuniculi]